MRNSGHDSALEALIVPRTSDLGGQFKVQRALPSRQKRMIGPFVFLDQMGPQHLAAGNGLDVNPHPHIGLATVTYLFDGELLHRDSLGTSQAIRPGEVNWMTAGCGIVHSERTPAEQRQAAASLHGLQCWVALPKAQEETPPSFYHATAAELPVESGDGIDAVVIAGEYFGRHSPVPTLSPLCYVFIQLSPQARLALPPTYTEQAIYLLQGELDVAHEGRAPAGQLLVIKPGKVLDITAPQGAKLMLLGGEPMDGPRAISWNFVSSSYERLRQAEHDWRHGNFPSIPGETEGIPMPTAAGRPVFYP